VGMCMKTTIRMHKIISVKADGSH